MNSNDPKHLQSSTHDAWLMLCIAYGLYVVSTLFFTKVSVLGGTAAGQVLSFLVPALLYAKWKSGAVTEALRLRPIASGITWRVVLLALTFIGLGSLSQQATQPMMERYFYDLIPLLELLMELLTPKSATGLVGNLVVVGLLAPVCEEVLFRGAFQGALERRGPVRAILASALIFAFVHLNPFNFLGIILIGIALGYVTWRTQSLWPAILWHAVNNSVATVMFYFGGESFSMPIWLDSLLALVFFGLALEFFRHTRRDVPAKPGPLATASALLGRKSSRLARAGGLSVALLLVAGAACFGRVGLASDFLAPDHAIGDIMIYARGPAFRPNRLQPSNVIIYRNTSGRLLFTRILAIDGEKITVIGPENENGERAEKIIERKVIAGKSIWTFDPGGELKALVRQVKPKGVTPPEGTKK